MLSEVKSEGRWLCKAKAFLFVNLISQGNISSVSPCLRNDRDIETVPTLDGSIVSLEYEIIERPISGVEIRTQLHIRYGLKALMYKFQFSKTSTAFAASV